MAQVFVDSEYCKSCELCISVCPKKVLEIGKKPNQKGYYAVVAGGNNCIGCMLCGLICPDIALEIHK